MSSFWSRRGHTSLAFLNFFCLDRIESSCSSSVVSSWFKSSECFNEISPSFGPESSILVWYFDRGRFFQAFPVLASDHVVLIEIAIVSALFSLWPVARFLILRNVSPYSRLTNLWEIVSVSHEKCAIFCAKIEAQFFELIFINIFLGCAMILRITLLTYLWITIRADVDSVFTQSENFRPWLFDWCRVIANVCGLLPFAFDDCLKNQIVFSSR